MIVTGAKYPLCFCHLRPRNRAGRLHRDLPEARLPGLRYHLRSDHPDPRRRLVALRPQRGRRLLVRPRSHPPPRRLHRRGDARPRDGHAGPARALTPLLACRQLACRRLACRRLPRTGRRRGCEITYHRWGALPHSSPRRGCGSPGVSAHWVRFARNALYMDLEDDAVGAPHRYRRQSDARDAVARTVPRERRGLGSCLSAFTGKLPCRGRGTSPDPAG